MCCLACVSWSLVVVISGSTTKESNSRKTSTLLSSLQVEDAKNGNLCLEGLAENKCSYRAQGHGVSKPVYKFVINEMLSSGWVRWNRTSDIPFSERILILHVCCGGEILYLAAPKIRGNETTIGPKPNRTVMANKRFVVDTEGPAMTSTYKTLAKTVEKTQNEFEKVVNMEEQNQSDKKVKLRLPEVTRNDN